MVCAEKMGSKEIESQVYMSGYQSTQELNGQIFNGLAKVVRRYRALFEALQENC
jgi:hypothetical protein